jgi:hypothetical protein
MHWSALEARRPEGGAPMTMSVDVASRRHRSASLEVERADRNEMCAIIDWVLKGLRALL